MTKKPSYEELLEENLILRKKIEQQENKSIEKELLEVIPDAFFLLNREGYFLKFIPAKNFQSYVPPEIFLGKNIRDIFTLKHTMCTFN